MPDDPEVPDDEPSGTPLTVTGQQTSLSPGFVGVHPAATAVAVSAALQSSLRGLPVCSAQSGSESAPAFCVQGTEPPPDDDVLDELLGKGAPQDPDSHFAVDEQGCVERDDVHCIVNVLPLNVTLHEPLSPLPRKPPSPAVAPVSVPLPCVPSSHRATRLHPVWVTSQLVFEHDPLSFQRPL